MAGKLTHVPVSHLLSAFNNKVLWEHKTKFIHPHTIYGCTKSQLYCSVVVTKIVRPRKPKIFTTWSLMERVNVALYFMQEPSVEINQKLMKTEKKLFFLSKLMMSKT